MEYGNLWERPQLKSYARGAVQKNYGNCVLTALVLTLIGANFFTLIQQLGETWDFYLSYRTILIISGVELLLSTFVFNIFQVGGYRFFVENRDYNAPVSKVLLGFQGRYYGNVVLTMFLMNLKIILWSLLLLIPGIIKAYEYRMVPYILAEQPDINQADAFAISREMMEGEKSHAFCLDLSFIGWNLLSVFTCGLLSVFWVAPYVQATNAELYTVLRDHWLANRNQGYGQGTQGENF